MKLLKISVGEQFNRWTVKERPFRSGRYTKALCQCDCGAIREVNLANVVGRISKSCGCIEKEMLVARNVKHGHSVRGRRERLYSIWSHMIQRCTNENDAGWKHYGGRGITVHKTWLNYSVFREWALSHGYKGRPDNREKKRQQELLSVKLRMDSGAATEHEPARHANVCRFRGNEVHFGLG
jgi:hypothetical protein